MQKLIMLFIAICYSAIVLAQKNTDNFSGKWKTSEGFIIEITKSRATFIGKPLGKSYLILEDLKFKNGKWWGVFPNPKKNTRVNCEAILEGNKIKFYTKIGIINIEEIWIKMN